MGESGRDKISKEEKAQREAQAMEIILGKQRPDLIEVWREYEDQNTPEARFVKDLDKLEMLIQADEYERGAGEKHITAKSHGEMPGSGKCRDLTDFYHSTAGKMQSGVALDVDAVLRKRKSARDREAA